MLSILTVLLFPGVLFASPQSAGPMGLTEAVRYALEHSPALDSSSRAAAVAELRQGNASAAFLPKLDLSSAHGFSRTKLPGQPVNDNPWTSSLAVSLTETLYDNHESITRYRIARLNSELARIDFERERASLCLDVARNYYRLSLSRKLAEVAHQRVKILSKQFASVSAQYRQGLKTRKDYLRFKTQVQRAEIDVLTSDNEIKVAEAELRRLLGVPLEALSPPAFAELEPEPVEPSRVVPAAPPPLASAYVYRSSRLQTRVNELNETFARRNYWPVVSVTAGASYENSGYLGRATPFSTTNALSWNGQLVLSYNLWDWGIRRRDVRIAGHTRGIQDNELERANLSLRRDIETLMLELRRLGENYKLNVELLKLSEQSYEFLEDEYRQGKVSYLDIITGLDELLDAKSRYYTAHFGLLQSLAQYRFFQGTLYETIIARNQSP